MPHSTRNTATTEDIEDLCIPEYPFEEQPPESEPRKTSLPPQKINAQKSGDEDLEGVKSRLDDVVDSMYKRRSLIARLAKSWGPKPLWLKAIIGFLILTPIVFVAVFASIVTIIFTAVLCAVVCGCYSFFSYALGDHYETEQRDMDDLKFGIHSLVDLLGDAISDLNMINKNFAEGVKNMSSENDRFTLKVNQLGDESTVFASNNKGLSQIGSELQHTVKMKLSKTTFALTELVGRTQDLLDEQLKKMERNEENHVKSLQAFQAELEILKDINTRLQTQLEASEQQCQILSEMGDTMQGIQTTFQERQAENTVQMKALMEEYEERMGAVGTQLEGAMETLEDGNTRHAVATQEYSRQVQQKAQISGQILANLGVFSSPVERQSSNDPKVERRNSLLDQN